MAEQSSFVDAEGIRLHYLAWDPDQQEQTTPDPHEERHSGDEIPLVMLHGLATTADTWRLVAPYLSRHHPVVAFDLRGHGQSDQPESGYDLVMLAEDVIHGMAALGLGKVVFVGHSWGARIGLILAARHPALVSHLVLVDGAYDEPSHWPGMTRERYIRQKALAETYPSRAAFLEAMQAEMADFWSPAVESIVLSYVRELPGGQVEARLRPAAQRLIRQSLWDDRLLPYCAKVVCPVLLIPAANQPQPGESPPEKLESAEDFAAAKGFMALEFTRAIRRCAILWMSETAHDIQLHRPQRLANAIANFVKGS